MLARGPKPPVSAAALASPIIILGAPRSGTTWLAKIIDSHPDVLYRHEPDETLPAPSPLTAETLPPLLARWAAENGARTATKRPYFSKSWQPAWAVALRSIFATAASAAASGPLRSLAERRIPDFATIPAPRLAIKSVAWAQGAALLARTMPASRTVFILRHPCGQVASLMSGNRSRRFDLKSAGTDMPFDEEAAIRHAAAQGLAEAEFQALPDAAKYAWSWRAFNEPAYAGLAAQPNVHVVLYEALCADPNTLARRILRFAALDWNPQTQAFIVRSTMYQGSAGYYSIYRNAVAAAEAWRTTMTASDQAAVRTVLRLSPLARFWPDLMTPP